MEFNPIGLRAAIEMRDVDRGCSAPTFSPVPYGINEHGEIVQEVLPSLAERRLVFWMTSNRIFLSVTEEQPIATQPPISKAA
jgi:hypothetical protein